MKKDYQEWHKKKKYIENDRPRVFFAEREVWFCYVGENIGFEQDGKGEWYARPCVIMRGFGPDACLVIPLTTSPREHALRVPVGSVEGFQARANLSQIRVVDTRRLTRKICFLDKDRYSKLRKAAKT